jgi:putative transposase
MAYAKQKLNAKRYYTTYGYASDLTDNQWEIIKPLLERKNNKGKHLENHEKRKLINAILYLNKTGCQWRMLPKDFPKYQTVASFYYRAVASGLWDKINALLVRKSREQEGRNPSPTYALIDSQSVKTTGAAEGRGYDGGKKSRDVKGIS